MNSIKAFEILKIKKENSIEEIKSAYRRLSRQHHPDRNLNSDNKNAFLEIKQAYDFLLNIKDQDDSETQALRQCAPNEFNLELTLEEIFTGCTKNEKIVCKVVDNNGIEKFEEKVLNVVIKPGVLTGTRITIDQEGDRHHGEIPANVVFTVHDKPNETFKRDRFDLKYTATISVEEVILGCELTIPTLDNDTVPLTIDGPITQETVKRIPNRGFPYPDIPNKRGDLVVLFNIVTQIQTIEKELFLTLAQAKNGCSKNIQINRKTINCDGTENFEDKILSIDIKPETQFGTQITFAEEGDQNESGKRSDVVFVVCQQPYEKVKQDKSRNDLSIYYIELNIPIGSSIQVIKEAYQSLMNELNASTRNSFIKKSMKIAEAYSQLIKIKFDEELTDSSVSSDDEEIQEIKQEKLAPNKFNLKLSLEEIYKGCVKHETITTKIINRNGAAKKQDKSVKVEVKPGSIGGTEIILQFEGDTCYGKINADVIFTVLEESHDIYRRNGYDIEYIAQITPKEAILGGKIIIQTLENKPFENNFDGGITPGTVQRIPDRGLPILHEKNKSGDLIIRFDIIFDDDQVNKTQEKLKSQKPKPENKKKFPSTYNFSSKTSENINKNKNANKAEKLPPNNFYLKLTLEEIYRGCVKYQTVSITKTLKNSTKIKEEKQLKVDVKPGSINGTKIHIPNAGDTCIGKNPADVIFTVREEPHSLFKRRGRDIEYIPKVKITQKEAILGGKLNIPTLENKPFEWTFKGGITSESIQRIPKRGLPFPNEQNQFGDMIVKCEVTMDQLSQDPPILHEIAISLEQILNGCTKKAKINRVFIDSQGNEKDESKILLLEIKPGTVEGTRFTFPREGDQHLERIPADIVFIVRDKPHETFTRNGADIEQTMTITKSRLRNGGKLLVPTLANDDPKYISLDGLTEKNAFRRIPDCGLPFPDKPYKRGDLLIKFKIEEDPQDEPIIRNLNLSYEQILSGWVKKMKIKSRIFDNNGNEILTRENTINVEVEKGSPEGKELRFEKLGDEYPGIIPADIIFVVQYKNHPIFERKGCDIYYTAIITTNESQNGVKFEIPTLEEKPLLQTIRKGVTINDIQKIENRGLPYPGDANKRGYLIVKYCIVDNDYKDPVIEYHLPLSLEKIFQGGEKQIKIKRQLLNRKGEVINEEKVVTINIPPGTKSGDKFTFSRLGDHLHQDRIPADLVFIAREKEHTTFKRNGNDVIYSAIITELQAMHGCTLQIPTLEYVELTLNIDQKITKYSIRKLKGKGLPNPNYPNQQGDIIVEFNIIENSNKQKDKLDKNSKLRNKLNQFNSIPQDETVEHYLPVSLENILNGCCKTMRINRRCFDETKNQYEERDKIVQIDIKPGTNNGERFVFPKSGDKNPNTISADVVFIATEERHPSFTRNGSDLLYSAKLTEQQYSNGHELQIPTLDGGPIAMYVSKEYDKINEVKRIHSHGLPLYHIPHVRGDIVVSFETIENVENSENANEDKRQKIQYMDYPLRLEDILAGYSKTITIDYCNTASSKDKISKNLTIIVEPGTPNGTHINSLDDDGNICHDFEFITTEIKHKFFKRIGYADIEYTLKISLDKASKGEMFEVPTLESGKKSFQILNKIPTSGTIEVIPNLGLPYQHNPQMRGNMLVKFEICDNETNIFEKLVKLIS